MYRQLMRVRQEVGGLGPENFTWLDLGHDDVLAYRRGDVVVVINMSDESREIQVTRSVLVSSIPDALLNSELAPNSAVWVRD